MSNLEIVRCTMTADTEQPVHQYGWMVRDCTTMYTLPFRSAAERERFVRLLRSAVSMVTPVDTVDTLEDLAALLCLARSGDEAAYACATGYLERELALLLDAMPLGELDAIVDQLMEDAGANERRSPEEGR